MARRGTVLLALLVALGASVSSASAEPLSMEFTEARANVGVQLSVTNDDDALLRPPGVAPLTAQIDPASGEITEGSWRFPTSRRTSPIPSTPT